MILKIAIIYIFGIFAESIFSLDLSFLSFISIMGFIIFYLKNNLINKGDFKKQLVLYVILLMSFIIAVIYTKYETYNSKLVSYPNSLYEVAGKVVSISETVSSKQLTLSTENIFNLPDGSLVQSNSKYIKILTMGYFTAHAMDNLFAWRHPKELLVKSIPQILR